MDGTGLRTGTSVAVGPRIEPEPTAGRYREARVTATRIATKAPEKILRRLPGLPVLPEFDPGRPRGRWATGADRRKGGANLTPNQRICRVRRLLRSVLSSRGIVVATAAMAAIVAGGGFEIHDETVRMPARRGLRLAPVPESGRSIEFVDGYAAGQRRAAAEGRPLFVVFRATWCPWCAEFSRSALVDRRLVTLSQHFVCVVVDADRHAADCRRFGVSQFPTMLLADPAGGEERRWTGCPVVAELVGVMAAFAPATRVASSADGEDVIR